MRNACGMPAKWQTCYSSIDAVVAISCRGVTFCFLRCRVRRVEISRASLGARGFVMHRVACAFVVKVM